MTMQLVQRDTLEGLAIPFGGPNRKDLQGEYFTDRTDFHLAWFPTDGRPVLYHHGLDNEAGGETIGRQISHEVKTDGVWVEVQLQKRSKWLEMNPQAARFRRPRLLVWCPPASGQDACERRDHLVALGGAQRDSHPRVPGCPDRSDEVLRDPGSVLGSRDCRCSGSTRAIPAA